MVEKEAVESGRPQTGQADHPEKPDVVMVQDGCGNFVP